MLSLVLDNICQASAIVCTQNSQYAATVARVVVRRTVECMCSAHLDHCYVQLACAGPGTIACVLLSSTAAETCE